MNNTLTNFQSPQIEKIHTGKVRDSLRVSKSERLIVVTDRISAFNKNLLTPVPHKGAILNGITNYWFEKTKHIIDNHLIKQVDANISLVKEANPIKIEMIVRAYLTGSMWRGYEAGQRVFCGVTVPDGMSKNEKFPEPILTPTTKDDVDSEIDEAGIFKAKLASKAIYKKMKEASLKLFAFGSDYLAEKGMILVDTKYEFGMIGKKLILIDEIHTPDSSRFWDAKDYKKKPATAEQIDKEFVRQWMLANKKNGKVPDILSDKVVKETTKRYTQIYESITEQKFESVNVDVKTRMYNNLLSTGLIKEAYVAIVMGSSSDLKHCNKIKHHLDLFNVKTEFRILSAHKNGERILELAEVYNNSIDPIVVIAVAGRSNGLGGALAANLSVPVINCPPFADKVDMMVNINSSLMMPSKTPALTVVQPDNAAYAAIRCLNQPSLKKELNKIITVLKEDLLKADERVKG